MSKQEEKYLKTKCTNCDLLKKDLGWGLESIYRCTLQKYTTSEKQNTYTYGLCHNKSVDGQQYDNQLTYIIYYTDYDLLETTLETIDPQHNVHIITGPNTDSEIFNKIKERIQKYKGWDIKQVLDPRIYDNIFYAQHHSSLRCKTHWMAFLVNGDIIPYDKYLSKSNQNYVCFYIDTTRYMTTKDAFKELEGHVLLSWLDKIKTFKNWKSVCQKINTKSVSLQQHIITEAGSKNTTDLYSLKNEDQIK